MSDNRNKLFKSMVNDIIKVFPEYTKRLLDYYKETLRINNENNNNDEKLIEFIKNVNEISDYIVEDDFSIFETDPILLQNVSFKLIWNSNISEDTKSKVWKYLQTFCILSLNDKSNEKIIDVIKSIESNEKVKDKKTLKDIKKLKKLNESIENDTALDKLLDDKVKLAERNDKNEKPGLSGMKEMEDMFQNTGIGKIAKDITSELNIEDMIENGGGIEDIFKGENMGNIIQSISKKISSENLQSGELVNEATNICSSMESNPLFSSLMGMQSEMLKNLGEGSKPSSTPEPSTTPEPGTRKITLDNPNHNPNVTRERLQRKLKEKKNMNIEKIE